MGLYRKTKLSKYAIKQAPKALQIGQVLVESFAEQGLVVVEAARYVSMREELTRLRRYRTNNEKRKNRKS